MGYIKLHKNEVYKFARYNQKSIEHIALYSLVLVGTLVVGVLTRQFVLSKGFDDFSSIVAFFATVYRQLSISFYYHA